MIHDCLPYRQYRLSLVVFKTNASNVDYLLILQV